MTEIKQAALCICILGAATGLLRMLIPSEKYKTRITFLIACIFSLCLINAVKGIIPSVSIDTQAFNVRRWISAKSCLSRQGSLRRGL